MPISTDGSGLVFTGCEISAGASASAGGGSASAHAHASAHTHAHGNLAKGMGDRWTLELLLTAGTWISGNRSLEDKHLSAKIGAADGSLTHEVRRALLDDIASRTKPGRKKLPGIACLQFQALPYLLTVLLLAGFVGRAKAPKASGIPFVKDR